MATIYLPRQMLTGKGVVQQMPSLLARLGVSKPLVVSDAGLQKMGTVAKCTKPLDEAGIKYDVFVDTNPDPSTEDVERCTEQLKKGDYDCIIAVGGGSPMDTAKAASVIFTHGGDMVEYKAPFQMDKPAIPIIAIPTTAGTGSEVTKFTIVTDTKTTEKMLCVGLSYMPIAAVCDYELTMSMPFRLTADTGIDTMCHAMEAYVSKKHNPFSDQVGLSCLDAIGKHLRTACNEPSNEGAREAMMLAATQGGMAFSNSSVTLVHGMSRPLGVFFHIPHGMSNAMLVPEVTNWSVEACVERYACCCRVLDMCDQNATDKDAAAVLPMRLEELCQELKVPTLQEFGVKKEKFFEVLPTMATMAIGSGSPGNNPKVPSAEEIIEIYTKIWNIGEEVTAKRKSGGS